MNAEPERGDRVDRGMSRRRFLGAGSAGAVGLAGAMLLDSAPAFASPSSDEEVLLGPAVTGTLKEVQGADTLILEDYQGDLAFDGEGTAEVGGSELAVRVTESSQLRRSGPIDGVDQYRPGDKLIAYVEVQSDGLVAIAVEPTFEPVEGTVSSRTDNRLETSGGTVVLDDATILVSTSQAPTITSLDDVNRGNQIFATCRRDPDSGEFVAGSLGVLSA